MIIGKYVFTRAKTFKRKLVNRNSGTEEDIIRGLQIYHSRFCGICFYRDEASFRKLKDIFLK